MNIKYTININKIKVSLVEDNIQFQKALISIINSSETFCIHSTFISAEEAMSLISNPPDIVLIDLNLPGMNGIDLINYFVSNSNVVCVVCSMHDNDEYIFKALENGASGYILKDDSIENILVALQEIIKGGAPMSPYIAKKVISYFKKNNINFESNILTEREIEVLVCLSNGLFYKEIAKKLFISIETVKKHIHNIYKKLNVKNKVEAINKFKNK